MSTHYLACDLGAESGRLMLGTLNEERLSGRRRLSDGDTLRLGRTRVTFRADAGEAPSQVSLSTTQRRVLAALCRPFKGDSRYASPASDDRARTTFCTSSADQSLSCSLTKPTIGPSRCVVFPK